MLLVRWVKQRHFMNDNLRKYVGYAAGEIVLVIVGILIALQIDAWYEDKQIRANLIAQLRSVSDSISQDLVGIANLKRHRTEAIFRSSLLLDLPADYDDEEFRYTREFINFASQLIASSQVPVYFVPSSGAYQALESSGHANHIRSTDLKRLLNDYYATVERIVFAERELNNLVREVSLKYETETTAGMPKVFLREPLLAWEVDPETGDVRKDRAEFRASYLQLIYDSVTQTLVRSNRNQPLLKEYEHLLSLGELLTRQIEAYIADERHTDFDAVVFSADSKLGPAKIFEDGLFEAHSFGFFDAPQDGTHGDRLGDLVLGEDYLGINYRGGDDWAFMYATVGTIEVHVGKNSLDYSRYDRIRLELKHNSGCEDLRLAIKDAEDADDGSQADVKLELSDEWATYEYPLSLFADADLTNMHVVAGFLMFGDACSFSVRDVTYLEPGES